MVNSLLTRRQHPISHLQCLLWTVLPAQGLCILHAGHLHLQPAAVPGFLHHHEGERKGGAGSAGSLPTAGAAASVVCISPQLRSSEKILPLPLFCIVATAVVWAAALYFFFQNLSSWEVRGPFFNLSSSHSLLPLGPFSLPCIRCFSSFPHRLSSQLSLGEKRQAACGQHGQGNAT